MEDTPSQVSSSSASGGGRQPQGGGRRTGGSGRGPGRGGRGRCGRGRDQASVSFFAQGITDEVSCSENETLEMRQRQVKQKTKGLHVPCSAAERALQQ
eukprot:6191064-Pleurochrysis_carterae.AAC.1